MDAPEYFKRYEQKYLLTNAQFDALCKGLEGYMAGDQYGVSRVSSIYYDTPDHRLIRRSLEKPGYKEKLRLRCYGEPNAKSPGFLEIKKKYDGVVYKRRAELPLADAERYLKSGLHTGADSQIFREIDYMRGFYEHLVPACFIGCTRAALHGLEDPELRMTFDWDIRWRMEDLSLLSGTEGKALLQPGQILLEIKAPGAMPLWLSRLLARERIYPHSFSKYGSAYLQSLQAVSGKNMATTQIGDLKGCSFYA